MASSVAQLPVFGVDDGYAAVKVVGDGISKVVPARVEAGKGLSGLDGRAKDGVFETAGQTYSVGDGVVGEDTAFEGYHTSPLNRVAVHAALHATGLTTGEAHLVLGLPLKDYFIDGEKNDPLVREKIKSFQEPVHAVGGGQIKFASIRIVPQGVAAVVDWGLLDDGKAKPEFGGEIGVVDIGGRTTDIAVIVGGNKIDHKRSGTVKDLGVLRAMDLLDEALRRKFPLEEDLSRSVLETAIRTRRIKLWADTYDIGPDVDAVLAELSEQMMRAVKKRLGSAAMLAKVLFVGGGAVVFGAVAREYRNAEVLPDPQLANARGMFKFGRLVGR